MLKFPSVEKFANIVKCARAQSVEQMLFRPKIKLHGSNGGVRLNKDSDEIRPQSRNRILSIGDDNYGFAEFISGLKLKGNVSPVSATIFGEWAGKGIHDTDAITKIDNKYWFLFCVVVDHGTMICDPDHITDLINDIFEPTDSLGRVKVLPWQSSKQYKFKTYETDEMQLTFDKIKAEMELTVGERDPYVHDEFGVDGPGEGFVFYPVGVWKAKWTDYMWKVKTAAHAEVKVKKERVIAPKPDGVDEFIDMFFTDVRMQKLLDEHFNGEADRKQTGQFLRAVMTDVHKESKAEMENVDFEWKSVAKYGVDRIKSWFFTRCDQL